jgi:nucleoside-diphosphate-sugar epimerase
MPRKIYGVPVCVVGGAGFLGSHLVNHLVEDRDCDVMVVDNLIAGRREFVHREARFEHHDITGSESYLLGLLLDHGSEYVFNYAAEPYIPLSFDRPVHVGNVNFMGAIKVINAAQEAGCHGILQVSSAEIYGDATGPVNEDAPIRPHSSYGATKAAIDYLVQARFREAKTPVIALRQFNCVGERETHPYVVPEIISQLHKAEVYRAHPEDIECRDKEEFLCLPEKNPSHYMNCAQVHLGHNSKRDFLYAGDAVAMAVELLEHGEFGEVYNLGSEESIEVYDLAKRIAWFSDIYAVVVPDESKFRPWEIWHLQSDNSKIRSVISRRAEIRLGEALERTINYFIARNHRWVWEDTCEFRTFVRRPATTSSVT